MKQRIITGLIAGIVFLAVLYWGGLSYLLFLLALALIGFDEFVKMAGFTRTEYITWPGYLLVLGGYADQMNWLPWTLSWEQWTWLSLFVFFALMVFSKNRYTIDRISVLWLAAIYLLIGFYYIAETRTMEEGLFWTLFILICTWASDTGAYFTGRWFGKTKLWPVISPKKTIEGSIGGIGWSLGIAVVFAWLQPELLTFSKAIVLGVVISLIGQLGDLMESAYKRYYDVKDSGRLLPGHGGVLDRVDSWIVVFPFLHLTNLLY